MGKLQIGIIGMGVGEAHIGAYESHPECEVVALCDWNPDTLERARKKYPKIRQFSPSADELLTDPKLNVVSIASYDDAHAAQVLTGLQHGKHLFVEKPLCMSLKEARAIRTAMAKNPSRKVSSNLVLRKSPRFEWLRDAIQTGKLGELFYLEGDYNYGRIEKITSGWRGEIENYSPVLGGGIHIIDLMLWLSGDVVAEVDATGNSIATRGSQYRHDDLVVAILHFKSGMKAKLSVNLGCVYPHFHRFSAYGTKATFENGLENGLLFENRDAKPYPGPKIIGETYSGIEKGVLIHDFVSAILKDGQPLVPPDEVFQALAVAFAINESLRSGKREVVQAV